MKAVKIYQAGGPEQLIYQDVPTPDIKEGFNVVVPALREQVVPMEATVQGGNKIKIFYHLF